MRFNKLHFIVNENCNLCKKISNIIIIKIITGKYIKIPKYQLLAFCNGGAIYSVSFVTLNEEIDCGEAPPK